MKSNRRTWCEHCVQQVQRRARRKPHADETLDERKTDVNGTQTRRKTDAHETLDERKSDAIFDRLFLVLILMHLVINFRCGREPENAEKTRDVW